MMPKETTLDIYKLVLKHGYVFDYTQPGDERKLLRIAVEDGEYSPQLTISEFLLYIEHNDYALIS